MGINEDSVKIGLSPKVVSLVKKLGQFYKDSVSFPNLRISGPYLQGHGIRAFKNISLAMALKVQ